MKKIFLAIAAALFLLPVGAQTAETVTLTKFEGEKITGVQASSAFDIVLVKSIATKAVVEIDKELEPYLRISHNGYGVVTIGTEMDGKVWRKLNQKKDRTRRLTLYLPEVNTIRLSGATDLTVRDAFSNTGDLDIHTSGASDIEGLNISAPNVKVQCSGASEVSMTLRTDNLIVMASGASEIDLKAQGVKTSRLSVSGASEVDIEGDCVRGEWTVSGASDVECEGFVVKNLSLVASGGADVHVNASDTLGVQASGGANVRYIGQSARVTSNVSGGASVKRM